jgi:hypothetical protein
VGGRAVFVHPPGRAGGGFTPGAGGAMVSNPAVPGPRGPHATNVTPV